MKARRFFALLILWTLFQQAWVYAYADSAVLWIENRVDGNIGRCDLDGTNRKVLVSKLFIPSAIAVDEREKALYWSSGTTIFRKSLDPGKDEGYKKLMDFKTREVLDIKFDHVNRKLVCSTESVVRPERASSIFLFKARGGLISDPYTIGDIALLDLALDPHNDLIYWSSIFGSKIYKTETSQYLTQELLSIREAPGAICFDEERRRIYYVEAFAHRMKYLSLDDGGVYDVPTQSSCSLMSIAIDQKSGFIFFSNHERNSIFRVRSNGEEESRVIDGLQDVIDIVIVGDGESYQ